MAWRAQLNANPLPWLLEPESPGVRYLALRDLVAGANPDELRRARKAAHLRGPIAVILNHMRPEGYWSKPGPGYSPKYKSTVWSLLTLAQLGASAAEDPRVARACSYVLSHMAPGGQFSSLSSGDPSGTIDCLQGNLCWSLLELGCKDPRLDIAFDWMARTVTGEGIAPAAPAAPAAAPRRYSTYKCGPLFACRVNGSLPCAWGGIKVMLALARLPAQKRTPVIRRAIERGISSFTSIEPVTAGYPFARGQRPNPNWWKFGFPVFYVSDLLQLAEVAVGHGYGREQPLEKTMAFILSKQNRQGRWSMDYDYLRGRLWTDFGPYKQPNKWVTLRALRTLKAAAGR